MSRPEYWLSASVLTMTSAPSFRQASRPAWKPAARPLLFVSRTMWSTPLLAGDLDRAVGRAVVDDQPLDDVEARDLAREVGQRCRERRLLVEAGDLDDELHARAGRGDGATGRAERSTPYTRWRPVSHMASATITRPAPGPALLPAAAAGFGRGRCSALAVLALGTRDRVPRLPDVSQLRQLLLAAVGPRAAARDQAVLRRLPRADRASAGRRLRRAALDRSAIRADRVMVGATLASFVVLAAGLYRLARGLVRHARRAGGRRPAVHALRLPVPGRARRTSTSPTWRSSCGPPRSRPSARAAAPSCSCCWPARGSCARRRGC